MIDDLKGLTAAEINALEEQPSSPPEPQPETETETEDETETETEDEN